MSQAIIVNGLTKHYGKAKTVAVDKASFSVEQGELFGLIGPDGAGKTSIFRMLTTVLLPDGGTASVNGFDIVTDYQKIRSSVGYMPGRFSLYQDLSVEENLDFFAAVFNTTVQANYHLIKDIYIQLEPFKKRRAGKLSGGMKQKLALCCALIHKPSVLFLDEPTTGVDPVSRKEFWEMLKRLRNEGITILVATPYMDEAALCSRIALIQNGKILSVESPQNISASFHNKIYAVRAGAMPSLLRTLSQFTDANNSYAFGEYAHLIINKDSAITEHDIQQYLLSKGYVDPEVKSIDATIEDSFISLLK